MIISTSALRSARVVRFSSLWWTEYVCWLKTVNSSGKRGSWHGIAGHCPSTCHRNSGVVNHWDELTKDYADRSRAAQSEGRKPLTRIRHHLQNCRRICPIHCFTIFQLHLFWSFRWFSQPRSLRLALDEEQTVFIGANLALPKKNAQWSVRYSSLF